MTSVHVDSVSSQFGTGPDVQIVLRDFMNNQYNISFYSWQEALDLHLQLGQVIARAKELAEQLEDMQRTDGPGEYAEADEIPF